MRFPAVLMLLATTLTACGGSDDFTGPSDTYSGTYTLRTVNGQSLPFLSYQVQDLTIEVVDDTLVVTDNGDGGSFTKQMAIRATASGQVRPRQLIHDAGTYTRNRTAATFEFSSAIGGCLYCSNGAVVGTIGGGKITLSDEGGVSWVYQK